MSRFVVAERRENRTPDMGVRLVRSVPGVEVVDVSPRGRMVIEADSEVVQSMQAKHGDALIIEPEAFYSTLSHKDG